MLELEPLLSQGSQLQHLHDPSRLARVARVPRVGKGPPTPSSPIPQMCNYPDLGNPDSQNLTKTAIGSPSTRVLGELAGWPDIFPGESSRNSGNPGGDPRNSGECGESGKSGRSN